MLNVHCFSWYWPTYFPQQFYARIKFASAFFIAVSVGSFINNVTKYSQTFAVSVKWHGLKSILFPMRRGNRPCFQGGTISQMTNEPYFRRRFEELIIYQIYAKWIFSMAEPKSESFQPNTMIYDILKAGHFFSEEQAFLINVRFFFYH